jgi:type VI secretion system secreted protein Hcp
MALPMYLKGLKIGGAEVKGGCDQAGNEGKILVQATEQLVHVPVNPQTGLTSGVRQHGPLVILKNIDKSTPSLYQALVNGTVVDEATLEYVHIDKTGKQVVFFTKKIENAVVISIKDWTWNCLDSDPSKKGFGNMEEVSFTYEKVTWTFTDGGVSSSDNWKKPNL